MAARQHRSARGEKIGKPGQAHPASTARTSDRLDSVPLSAKNLATGEQTLRPAQNDPKPTLRRAKTSR
jgi:hypothetical protein